jgi:hypothetical protein
MLWRVYNMTNTVFFNAVDATVQTQINNKIVGYSATAEELRALLEGYNVTGVDTFLHSSDVDFASEEGFDTDDDAHAIIDGALAQL